MGKIFNKIKRDILNWYWSLILEYYAIRLNHVNKKIDIFIEKEFRNPLSDCDHTTIEGTYFDKKWHYIVEKMITISEKIK